MPFDDLMLRHRARRRQVLLALAGGSALTAAPVWGRTPEAPLPVVATFSILGDMLREVGGERVAVTTIVGVNGDVHRFEPSPRDAKALLEARVLVLNGLDFETWLPRLVQASGFAGQQVLASDGVPVRRLNAEEGHDGHEHDAAPNDDDARGDRAHDGHAHGEADPHAWQSLENGMIYARNIARGLAQADPRNAAYYASRAESYISRMRALDNEIRTGFAAIPKERRRVITAHDSFGYFGDAYGIEFIPVAGLSNQAEPSAADLARIVRITRESRVSGIFIENMTNPALAQQIARETGVLMGGTLYADALGPADEPAGTYLGMVSWNAGRLLYVLRQAGN